MNNISEKLAALVTYYDSTRQTGHTGLMMKGVLSADKCAVVAHNQAMEQYLRNHWDLGRGTKIVTINNLDSLRGTRLPLAIDNAALSELLREALEKIQDLTHDNEELEKRNEWLNVENAKVNDKLQEAKENASVYAAANRALSHKFEQIAKLIRQ